MAAIHGEQAILRLAAILRDRNNDEDQGPLAEAGQDLTDTFAVIRKQVERTGKPCTGEIAVRIKLKGYRSKGGEVAVDAAVTRISKRPTPPARETTLFLDHEGAAHTTPQQEDLPMFNPKAVSGGKDDKQGAPKAHGKAV